MGSRAVSELPILVAAPTPGPSVGADPASGREADGDPEGWWSVRFRPRNQGRAAKRARGARDNIASLEERLQHRERLNPLYGMEPASMYSSKVSSAPQRGTQTSP